MLGYFHSHKEYMSFVLGELNILADTRPDQIAEYKDAVLKMLILNLDPLLPVITPLYSPKGRPAVMQMEIFRSFILMSHTQTHIDKWIDKLINNPVLRAIAGFTLDNMPKMASYYDFINRIVPLDDSPIIRQFKSKPPKKLKKGEKLPPKNKKVM